MRGFVVAFVIALAGCSAQGLPLDNGGSGATGGNGGGATGGNGAVDMSRPRDLGGQGATCKTACDCQSGLGCLQGTCQKTPFGNIYCCDSGDCPAGNFCQSSSGGFGQCGQGGSGGTGGGGGFPGGGGGGGGFVGGGPGGGGGFPGGGGGGGGFGGGPGGGGGFPGGGGGGTGGFGGGPGGGLPDGGLGMFCTQVPCQSSGICMQLGCGACSKSGTCSMK